MGNLSNTLNTVWLLSSITFPLGIIILGVGLLSFRQGNLVGFAITTPVGVFSSICTGGSALGCIFYSLASNQLYCSAASFKKYSTLHPVTDFYWGFAQYVLLGIVAIGTVLMTSFLLVKPHKISSKHPSMNTPRIRNKWIDKFELFTGFISAWFKH